MKDNIFTISGELFSKINPKCHKWHRYKCGRAGKETLDIETLERVAFANRVNALSCIMAARHGWLGATFSCAEILTYLYFGEMEFKLCSQIPLPPLLKGDAIEGDMLILSKGHAAPMQYACLAGLGVIPFESLLTYKTKDGLQAHTDRNTPGIISNTGSLGQSLSKAAGLALAGRLTGKKHRIYVILGDGELQEGQNYEALMTLKKYGLSEVIPVIDRNFLQTDSQVKDIKEPGRLPDVFKAFGFETHSCRGNDMDALKKCFSGLRPGKNSVIIADTVKGAGSSITAMSHFTKRRKASWHSAVPEGEVYIGLLDELVKKINTPVVTESFEDFKRNFVPVSVAVPANKEKSTRDIFSETVLELAHKNKKIIILDADLEKSMKLTAFAEKYPERFVEAGISEQDMASMAGGLGLKGFVPIVNTYASFFRRCFEQIYINATEKTPVIYAGHYSGLCYSSDGKSHQMAGDIAMMRSIPGMRVYDPYCGQELVSLLNYYFSSENKSSWKYPVYIRLRRTPADFPVRMKDNHAFKPDGIVELKRGKGVCLIGAGPHLSGYCLEAARRDGQAGAAACSAQNYLDRKNVCEVLGRYKKVIIFEESVTAGGLGDEITGILSGKGIKTTVLRKGVDDFTFSCRDKADLFSHFGLDLAGIQKTLHYSNWSL